MFDLELNRKWIAILGGIILVVLGLKYLLRPNVSVAPNDKLSNGNTLSLLSAGFLVNFVNPFVFIVWITLTVHARSQYPRYGDQWLFLTAVLLGIFTGDLLKSLFAHRIGRLLATDALKRVYSVIGVALLIFSIRVFLFAFEGLFE